MSELSFMAEQFDVIQNRTVEVSAADEDAVRLEARAEALRQHAGKLRLDADKELSLAFEEASIVLVEGFAKHTFSSVEVVRAIEHMTNLDPVLARLYKGQRGEHIAKNFEALQPGTPVILSGDDSYGAICRSAAKVTKIHTRKKSRSSTYDQPFMAPWAEIAIPLKTLGDNGNIQNTVAKMELSRLAGATVGRAALQALAQNAQFTTHTSKDRNPFMYSNGHHLKHLKSQLQTLQRLGMQSLDMSALEKAIQQADSFAECRRLLAHNGRRSRHPGRR